MSEVITHAPGTFCWVELGTTDQEAAKAFYGDLLGWDTEDSPIGPDAVYTMISTGGQSIGGLHTLTQEQHAQGIPPHWGLYVSTDDADATTARAKELGATVIVEPFDVMEEGRMAVLRDPTGAVFSVWQAINNPGAGVLDGPGALVWSELATHDAATAGPFYAGLFGWAAQEQDMATGPYTMFLRGEVPAGGMIQMTEEWGEAPPNWMPYFGVADCAAAVAKAEEMDATILVPPTAIPDIGTFAVIRDPQGAVFSIIQMVHFGA